MMPSFVSVPWNPFPYVKIELQEGTAEEGKKADFQRKTLPFPFVGGVANMSGTETLVMFSFPILSLGDVALHLQNFPTYISHLILCNILHGWMQNRHDGVQEELQFRNREIEIVQGQMLSKD